jgi:hypothetical protein
VGGGIESAGAGVANYLTNPFYKSKRSDDEERKRRLVEALQRLGPYANDGVYRTQEAVNAPSPGYVFPEEQLPNF